MPRVCVVTESFPALDSQPVRPLVDQLVDRGHEVVVLAGAPGLDNYRGATVVRIGRREVTGVGRGSQVRAALRRARPDLIHVVAPGPLGRRALKQGRDLGLPTVTTETAAIVGSVPTRWRRHVADTSDRLLVTATWMRDRLTAQGVDAALWAPGVDADLFTPALRSDRLHHTWSSGASHGPLVVVGYAGSLRKPSGVRTLTDVAKVSGTRVVVIGEDVPAWVSAALPEVRFVRGRSSAGLATALASVDVMLDPGVHQTCCHLLRAACASAVPVAAPAGGGAPDVIDHLQTGLLYDPTDRHGPRRAVTALAGDPHRRLLGRHGRERVRQRTWSDAVGELIEGHYDEVWGSRPDRRRVA